MKYTLSLDHWPSGDGTFFDDCYPQILPAVVFTGAHSTIDPVTLEVIEAPILMILREAELVLRIFLKLQDLAVWIYPTVYPATLIPRRFRI